MAKPIEPIWEAADRGGAPGPGGAPPAATAPAIELRGITKRYGQVVACDGVDLAVRRGEIHGLLGENGAGKSTLMKVLSGLVRPDSGVILRDGVPVDVADPHVAAGIGVAMVHQHFSLVGALTVWENVVLGDGRGGGPALAAGQETRGGWLAGPHGRRGRLRRDEACADVVRVGERYGITVDPLARVDSLSAGQRQRVEIIKCLRRDPDVIVLDEPTSVLSLAESRDLFAVLRRAVTGDGAARDGAVAGDGTGDSDGDPPAKAVVLISHKLAEILGATDRVTVLRRGRVVARRATAGTDAATLAREMVGREVSLGEEAAALGLAPVILGTGENGETGAEVVGGEDPAASGATAAGEVTATDVVTETATAQAAAVDATRDAARAARDSAAVLELDGVTVSALRGAPLLEGFALGLRAGEIVGLYGVEGNGQSALGDVLAGLIVPDRGEVRVGGEAVDLRRPGALHAAGVGVIPEDRHRSGVVLDMSVADNLVMTDLGPVSGKLLISRRRQLRHAAELAERFAISCSSLDAPLRTLSGGNQQRVVLARELAGRPAVLVAAQPTRGLDVGAIEGMYAELRAAAARGVAVLLVSTELEEVMALSHRIVVISAGRVVGELAPDEADAERLGLLVGGAAGPASAGPASTGTGSVDATVRTGTGTGDGEGAATALAPAGGRASTIQAGATGSRR
ncbi:MULTISPECIES: ABC transporter ATP-binding protein [unclassified Pseudofrankia]|uniref:ABC transporter ATP-binding protein n=1 Tax=unclassified Pseudofrankia TaxID=2994372 RepID=UPI0008D989B9|nr:MULTISPECIES: ATP-binding cassette domain-containing protein [unclassified Pseudofrankia]MDT3440105.1 ATP-binding cassette domain-containing protein [Pseudofrankia sp. BMG5.37]OHV44717.1 hypothetical protein BCD48_24870 [Pseudofrankia sp. BMG5.36]